ncbi:hypothetical protein [Listeria valentina]|uniref:hypothetical protein n=1 Tax=Listeria valentina TaxID=2705293 RepID=UPI00142FBD84|nr:hypothetical protein [Listeria valentina]
MHHYFIRRIFKRKPFQIALATGMLLSLFYLIADIYPNRFYGGSPYTRWIESFTGSEVPHLLFKFMPIIAAMAAADIYASDKKAGFFDHIYLKRKKISYFANLYGYNFILGGVIFIAPLLLNIYGCFMLLPNHQPDLVVTTNEAVPLLNSTTLFPELYYAHPFLHMLMYIGIAFFSAGMFATIALAVGMFLKQSFVIFLTAYIIDYLWNYVIPDDVENVLSYYPTLFSKQITSPVLSWQIMVGVLCVGTALATIGYIFGVRKNVIK